jgi:DNA-binding XRE family transcriptional regulator
VADRFKPVPHDAAFKRKLLADPKVRAAYDALADEYAALDALLAARKAAGLTQAEVAERMGIKPSALSRLEGNLGSKKHSPSLETLRKYARACGKKLEIRIV